MKKLSLAIVVITSLILMAVMTMGASSCDSDTAPPSSDAKQNDLQEKALTDAVNAVGIPAIINWREKRILKDIYELRDQEGLVTYTYVESELTGKFRFLGQSVGYGIPYSTQYTQPEKAEYHSDYDGGNMNLPQAEPNGLYTPPSAEGTWVLLANPENPQDVRPIYVEPRILVSPFKLPDSMVLTD